MRITPTSELNQRIQKMQAEMLKLQVEAAFIVQNADLFYLTGSIQQGVLYVPPSGEPLYMVRKDHGRARMESGLREVLPLSSPREIPAILSDFGHQMPQRIGMDLDVIPYTVFKRFEKALGFTEAMDVSPLLRAIRAVKSDYEINILKDAALIVNKVCERAREVIKVGMTDLELSAELELVARQAGHQGFVRMRGFNNELFYGHVFSGNDSAVPTYSDTPLGGIGLNPSFPQGASYKKINPNEPITVDFSGIFDGYIVDQTRMFSVGEVSQTLMQAYADMVSILEHARQIALPGISWGQLYDDCYEMACNLGYRDHFMGAKGSQVSFIGHGTGIELDEYPFIAKGFNDNVLEENMVFAFEPKAVFPGLGAVGIEDTFWVSGQGLKSLTFADRNFTVL